MADDFDDDNNENELEKIWNPGGSKASPLAKKPIALVVSDGKEAYSAFVAKESRESFIVRLANGHHHRFYIHRLTGVHIYPQGTALTIKTNDGIIQLYGRRLETIDEALALHTCRTITEFSPEIHLPPTDKSAPFIEQIDVILPRPPEKPQRVAKAEKTPEEA